MKYLLIAIIIISSLFLYVNQSQNFFKSKIANNHRDTCSLDLSTIQELHYIAPGMHEIERPFYIGIRIYTDIQTQVKSSQLFTVDKELNCNSIKALYSIEIPGEDNFYTPAITTTYKYILIKKHEVNDDYMITNLNGDIISMGILQANPQISRNWEANSIIKLANDRGGNFDKLHLILNDLSGKKDAIVRVDLPSGKLIDGSFTEINSDN